MAILDVVKWDGAPNVFAYRYPNCELTTKSQVVVYESQEAVFVKDGNFYAPLGPGRHILDTPNDPFVTRLMRHLVTDGKSPFVAEVWFVNKAIPLDIKWGTTSPIQIEDPKYHIMMPIRAYGQYGLRVERSQQFLAELVGRIPVFTTKTLSEYFRGIIITQIKDCIASYFVESSLSVLQISSHLSEISNFLQEKLSTVIEEYGVKLIAFNVNSISTDEGDPAVAQLKRALAKKAEMDIVGYTYQQEKSFDVMSKAAANQGSGAGATMMQAGMGLNLGMGIAAPIGAAMGGIADHLSVNAKRIQESRCPKCGYMIDSDANFCSHCGYRRCGGVGAQMMIACDKCGHKSPKGTRFCPRCGDPFLCCPNCGADNPEDANICRGCGKALPRSCVSCGTTLPDGSKYCPNCGKEV